MKSPQLIAEVKTESPFGMHSERSWDEQFELADQFGDMISIHTDPRWAGSLQLLKKARAKTAKPILAKGVHVTDDEVRMALDAGADRVLIVGRETNMDLRRCLLEPLSLAQLQSLPAEANVVWNSRDLRSGGLKSETFEDARQLFSGWLCQASNIRTVADIKPGADAILVGTHLEEFVRSLGDATMQS